MNQKRVLVPARLRRPPATGWSWIDRRFVREHLAYLSRDAAQLYFFLAAVADRHGVSFYSDATVATQLHMSVMALVQAREELLARNLIAHEVRFTQVLSMPSPLVRRRSGSGGGLIHLGEILRRVAELSPVDQERGLP
jgi:hypothetical protein